jgi:two-component system cell cycle sensor histidine kinase/response regulator CckA
MPPIPAIPPAKTPLSPSSGAIAFKVAGIYASLASAWIVISDYIVAGRNTASPEVLWLEIGKGLGFVAVTSVMLVLLVRHYWRRLQEVENLRWAGEPQFRTLVEQSLVGVYLIQDNRFVYVNPRMADIFGYSAEEIVQRLAVSDLVAPSNRDLVQANLARRLSGEVTRLNYSFRGLHRNGWPLQIEVFGSRIEHQGRPAIIGTLLDVTDRYEAEAALRESELRYRLLIQTAPDAIFLLDVEHGAFVDFNHQAELLFELSGDELSRRGPLDLSPEFQPDGRRSTEAFASHVAQAVAGSLPAFEWVHRSQSGREIPCEVRLVRLPAQDRTLIRGSITDITERHRTAEALARSEENYRTLFEQATDAIFLCAADGRLVDINRHAMQLTGYSREELLQKNAFDVITPEDHEYLEHCMQELLKQGARFSIYRFCRKDGSVFPGETSTKLLPDGRLLAMVRDITERRESEGQRLRLEQELRQAQKLQAIGTLAGGIAHDFNNILAAILGNAQLLKLLLPPAHEGQGNVSQILVASHRAKDLVQQILMFSRQREQLRQILQLEPLLKEAVKLIGVSLPSAVKLELAIAPGLPAVLADPTQIHQVIVNLCTNALHALRSAGGTLQLALSLVSLPEESTSSKPNLPPGRYVCLTVADTGHGMDAATLERIYEPFFTTKPVGEGTGLGLAVVHGIVQSNDGAISVASHPGKGTTFKLYFPAQDAKAEKVALPAEELKTGGGQHILFVDDEAPIAEVAGLMLTKLGYRATVYTDSRQALEYLQNNNADLALLLTDLSMPGLNGVDLIREAMRLKPGLPAILLTGYGKVIDSKAALELHISEVMHKPFTMEMLSAAIESALEAPR